jgi:hypothetical protein
MVEQSEEDIRTGGVFFTARKVKARLRMLQHDNSERRQPDLSFFGVSRALFDIWKKRYERIA